MSRRRAGHGSKALLGLALLAAPEAWAQPNSDPQPVEASIEIVQAPGSEACADKEAVFRSIRRLFPEREFRQGDPSSQNAARARVTIRPLSPGHEAVVTLLPPRQGERIIREEDESCRGLADALALAFVMLVAPPEPSAESSRADVATKPEATAQGSPKPAETKTPAPEERVPVPARLPESKGRTRSYRAGFGASFVGGFGVLSEPALGAGGELELFHERGWGLSLQGLRLWATPAEAEGGSVTLTLWGGLVGPCYRFRLGETGRLDGCLRFGIGSQRAEVQGFVSPESGNFPWEVLVPSVSYRYGLAGLGERLSGFVRVGFVGQLRPQSFSVRRADSEENLEIASAPKFGVMTDIGLVFGTGPF
ncbi:MAG TPA: hypothetical protein VER11_26020 [Polyangiaceae bacterium]|nr:hypothetical protein [Polyangiaceae bacterium]